MADLVETSPCRQFATAIVCPPPDRPVGSASSHHRGHAGDGLGKKRAGRSRVQSHEPSPVQTEVKAAAERDASTFEKMLRWIVAKAEFGAVQPGKIGGLRRNIPHGGQAVGK